MENYFSAEAADYYNLDYVSASKMILPDLIPINCNYCPQDASTLDNIPDPLTSGAIDYCPQNNTSLNQLPEPSSPTSINYCPQDETQLNS